jgi:hypothetical protein
MELLILGIEGIVEKLHLCITMTIDAPAHTHISNLFNAIHLLNGTVTGGTFDLSHSDMLGMTKECMILQVVDPYPFNGSSALIGCYDLINLVPARIGAFPDD